jgi:hypothetical protein
MTSFHKFPLTGYVSVGLLNGPTVFAASETLSCTLYLELRQSTVFSSTLPNRANFSRTLEFAAADMINDRYHNKMMTGW